MVIAGKGNASTYSRVKVDPVGSFMNEEHCFTVSATKIPKHAAETENFTRLWHVINFILYEY